MVGTQNPRLKLMDQFHCKLLCHKVALWVVVLLRNAVPVSDLQAGANCSSAHERVGISDESLARFLLSKFGRPKPKLECFHCPRLHVGFPAAYPYSATLCEFAVTPTKKRKGSQPNPPTQSRLSEFLRVGNGGSPKHRTQSDLENPKMVHQFHCELFCKMAPSVLLRNTVPLICHRPRNREETQPNLPDSISSAFQRVESALKNPG